MAKREPQEPKKAKVDILPIEDRTYKNGFIFIAGTKEEANKYFEEQNLGYEAENELDGVCIHQGADCYIYIEDLNLGTLVHECIHAAQFSMDYRGIDTGIDNTEITAHLTQWLFEISSPFYLKYFNKQTKNAKK